MRFSEIYEAPQPADATSGLAGVFGAQIDHNKQWNQELEFRKGSGSSFGVSTGGVNGGLDGGLGNPGTAGNLRFAKGALTRMNGSQSDMTRSTAGQAMQATIRRAQNMARIFGGTITVNDAIAKRGTSRERETQSSQHFNGTALDISTAGMDNETKLRLVAAAQRAGFTGFGFGNGILHVDTGPRRHWSYGNSSFGGVSVASLGAAVRAGKAVA
jgi:hypothetical protein